MMTKQKKRSGSVLMRQLFRCSFWLRNPKSSGNKLLIILKMNVPRMSLKECYTVGVPSCTGFLVALLQE